jgi:uncharacterized small protein (DUF1192 family)
MDDDERPRSGASARFGAASQLAGENLDGYSLDELDARISLLENEIARVASHRNRAAAHKLAADAMFRPKQT